MLLGSHVSFTKEGLLGSTKEALKYGANTFMFYTGAPQNTIRKPIDKNYTLEAQKLMKENSIDITKVVCHAPYIVNLANNTDLTKYKFAIDFLKKEVERCKELGIKLIVLHPGSAVSLDRKTAIKNIVYALNNILEDEENICICLETMAGKGTEIGVNMNEIKSLLDGVKNKKCIGVCLDTCHLNDSGVDISNFSNYLDEFDKIIGLDKVKVIHVNDSKNELGSKKDRHENIGFGTIGFDSLINVLYEPRLENIPKILETPHIKDNIDSKKSYPPYKEEIEMILSRKFNPTLIEDVLKNKLNWFIFLNLCVIFIIVKE